ncbi:MAG: hydrogenase maturation protease [Clostridiaceae bacterium]|nr:hydrogenase maturation protease [Clostridiaceae bacterium]
MKEILVLGIGNRLMMDDGIGVYIAEALKERNTNPNIRYVVGETDIYFCLEQIKESSFTVIIDAALLGNRPGTICVIPLDRVFSDSILPISAHDSHLLNEIIMMDKNVEGLFIGIEPYEINYALCLSQVLQKHFPGIIEEVENIIEDMAVLYFPLREHCFIPVPVFRKDNVG